MCHWTGACDTQGCHSQCIVNAFQAYIGPTVIGTSLFNQRDPELCAHLAWLVHEAGTGALQDPAVADLAPLQAEAPEATVRRRFLWQFVQPAGSALSHS